MTHGQKGVQDTNTIHRFMDRLQSFWRYKVSTSCTSVVRAPLALTTTPPTAHFVVPCDDAFPRAFGCGICMVSQQNRPVMIVDRFDIRLVFWPWERSWSGQTTIKCCQDNFVPCLRFGCCSRRACHQTLELFPNSFSAGLLPRLLPRSSQTMRF